MACRNGADKECGALKTHALKPSCISYKPKINSRAIQGDRSGVEVRRATGVQGKMGGHVATVQATVPDESRADVAAHGLWKWGTYALFDMRIVKVDAGCYLRKTSAKALTMAEKDNKDKYPHLCLDRRHNFNSMVYSTDVITDTEAVAMHRRLA